MKFRRLIISLLAGLMLVSGCSDIQKGCYGRVIKVLNSSEVEVMTNMIENHKYELDITPSDSKVKAVEAFYYFGDSNTLSKFSSLSRSYQVHSSYLEDCEFGDPVYGPVVFNKSIIDGESDGVYFVTCITSTAVNYGITECNAVTFENGCLKVDLDLLYPLKTIYKVATDFIIIEIDGCRAEDIESVMLEFVPQKQE